MSSEIVKRESHAVADLPIQSMNDLATLGQFIAQSGMLGASSPAAGMIIASTCVQEGMSLLEFGRRYHVDNRGKVTMRADRALAEFMERGGTCKWITDPQDREKQTGEFTFGVNKDLKVTFSFAEAVEAGYVKDGTNWTKDPASQMRARVIMRGVRMVCPAAIAGIYSPEEMQDVYNSEPDERGAPVPSETEITIDPTPQAATVEVINPNETTPFDDVDYNVCPPIEGCIHSGKPWAELSNDDLGLALTSRAQLGLQDGHVKAVNAVLKERKVI